MIRQETLNNDGETVVKYVYTLGSAGERKAVTELDRTVEYTYDNLYRLTSETITEGEKTTVYTYAYDNVSNRILKTENGKETEYVYNSLNQLVSDSETTYEYDLNGNLIRVVGLTNSALYEYNAENRLVKATVQQGNNVVIETYTYDYSGNRTSKTTNTDGNVEYVKYLNDNSNLTNVLAEIDETGTVKCVYTIGADLISQERDGKVSVYIYDGHGSVVGLATMSGKVTDTYEYDAFGNLLKSTGKTANNYLYCGEQFDSTTGLYYLRARYMDTSTGRFISQDSYAGSISDPVSLHKYLYANSNPVMYSDPSGYVAAAVVQAVIVNAIVGIIICTATAYLSNVFALRDETGEFNWSWNLSTEDVCKCIIFGGALGALGTIAIMCQFVVATSILIASAVGFGLFNAYECYENAKNGNIYTAIFQGILALVSIFSACKMAKTMGGWDNTSAVNKSTAAEPTKSSTTNNNRGAMRALKFRDNWSKESLIDTINKIAPDSEGVLSENGNKIIFENKTTGQSVIYDIEGDYFRVQDSNILGKRCYTDVDGNPIPNNTITENGTQRGITQDEYNSKTHFK